MVFKTRFAIPVLLSCGLFALGQEATSPVSPVSPTTSPTVTSPVSPTSPGSPSDPPPASFAGPLPPPIWIPYVPPPTPPAPVTTPTPASPVGPTPATPTPAATPGNGPRVWVAQTLHRVGLNDGADSTIAAQVAAARGAYASFQIVVNGAPSALSNVNVSVSDLTGPSTISRANFTLYREQYVHVTSGSPSWGGSNDGRGAGWYADGLIPFTDPATGQAPSGGSLRAVPFSLPAGQNQPIWVDLQVPRTAAAGQYAGTFTVTSDQGSTTGQVYLTVWNFTLPMRPTLKSAFLLWSETYPQAQQELLRHKIEPSSTTGSNIGTLISSFGLGATNAGLWSGADVSSCSMSPAPSVAEFSAAAAARPGVFLYDYSADEIDGCPGLFPTLQSWARNMHAAGINNLVTMSPNPALFDDGSGSGRSAVDIWVMLPKMYDNAQAYAARALQKGDSLWSYNTLIQDGYSPKWEIDYDPINFRIQPGFISQSLSLTGMLYWRADRFTGDPWNDPNTTGAFSPANYPGEAMLLYPGAQVGIAGVVPSMRLKWLRDGVEDYEYVEFLKNLGNPGLALQIARGVGPDWTNWTRDANAVASARQQLGEAINQIVGSRSGF